MRSTMRPVTITITCIVCAAIGLLTGLTTQTDDISGGDTPTPPQTITIRSTVQGTNTAIPRAGATTIITVRPGKPRHTRYKTYYQTLPLMGKIIITKPGTPPTTVYRTYYQTLPLTKATQITRTVTKTRTVTNTN